MIILMWIVFGLIAGALAKFLMPGNDPGGFVVTVVLGIVGSVVGGFVGTMLGLGSVQTFDLRGMLLAVGGAMIVLAGYRMIAKKSV